MSNISSEKFKVALIFRRNDILIVASLPPISTSLDLDHIETVELQSSDERIIGVYKRCKK